MSPVKINHDLVKAGREFFYKNVVNKNENKKNQINNVIKSLENAIEIYKGNKHQYTLMAISKQDGFEASLNVIARQIVYDVAAQKSVDKKTHAVYNWLLTKCKFETDDLSKLESVVEKMKSKSFLSEKKKKAKQKLAKEAEKNKSVEEQILSTPKKKEYPSKIKSTTPTPILIKETEKEDVFLLTKGDLPREGMPPLPPRPSMSFDESLVGLNDSTEIKPSFLEQLKGNEQFEDRKYDEEVLDSSNSEDKMLLDVPGSPLSENTDEVLVSDSKIDPAFESSTQDKGVSEISGEEQVFVSSSQKDAIIDSTSTLDLNNPFPVVDSVTQETNTDPLIPSKDVVDDINSKPLEAKKSRIRRFFDVIKNLFKSCFFFLFKKKN